MLALWRRVRKSVGGIGDTEWAILAIETAAVVGGVFLAFQLGNWVEESRASAARDALLERLFEESEVAAYHTANQSEAFGELVKQQQAALAGWINDGACPTSEGWSALGGLRRYPALSPPSTAYDEMIGSGGLSMIDTAEARTAVSAYHSELIEYAGQIEYFRMESGDGEIPIDTGGTMQMNPETGSIRMVGEEFGLACASEELKKDRAARFRNFRVMQGWREDVAAKALAMCEALGREVGRQCKPEPGDPSGPS